MDDTSHVMTMHARIIFGTVWLLMSLVPAIIGFFIVRRSFNLRFKGVLTEGTIIGCDKRQADTSWNYFPQVEFESADGEKHVFTASSGGGSMPRVGRRVRVAYYPHDPDDADIASFAGISFFAVIMFFFAAAFFGMSLVFYLGMVNQ